MALTESCAGLPATKRVLAGCSVICGAAPAAAGSTCTITELPLERAPSLTVSVNTYQPGIRKSALVASESGASKVTGPWPRALHA